MTTDELAALRRQALESSDGPYMAGVFAALHDLRRKHPELEAVIDARASFWRDLLVPETAPRRTRGSR